MCNGFFNKVFEELNIFVGVEKEFFVFDGDSIPALLTYFSETFSNENFFSFKKKKIISFTRLEFYFNFILVYWSIPIIT
jgi:hypothetical protein